MAVVERYGFLTSALVGGLAVVWVAAAAGQAAPLRKTDLIRLLTNPSLSKAQVAQRVRAACLAFEPTGRDRVDLQALGADAAVMGEINTCLRNKAAAAAAAAPTTTAARPQTPPQRLPAARPATPAARPPAQQPPARTTPTPAAPAPTAVAAARPGPPAAAEVEPTRLQVLPGQPAARRVVTVTVRDARGTPVPGERVEFRPLTPGLGVNAFSGATNRAGQFSATFSTASLRRTGEMGIFVRGAQRTSLSIEFGSIVLSDAATRFVSGDGQRGVAGRALEQALVLEVRDTTGAPVVGKTVTFAATNGSVTPASAVTDAQGQVSASVVAGREAGRAVVAASVDSLHKEVTIPVAPGPARTLVVQRDTARLGPTLALDSKRPVILRVMARDTFGNEVRVTGVRASVRDPGVVRVARADTAAGAGRVELRAQGSGTTQVELDAAGVRESFSTRVLLPVAAGGGMLAVRLGYTTFDYGFLELALQGRPGPIGEVAFGWSVGGLRVAMGVTVAKLRLDTGTVKASTQLAHGSLRVEYSMLSRGSVRPVVTLGAGQYQTRATDLGGLGRHSNRFWLAGGGLDFPMRPGMTVELRAASHQLLQSRTQYAEAGKVGALTAVTVGFRFGS